MENCKDFCGFIERLLSRKVPMGYILAGSVAELPLQYVFSNLTDFDHMNFCLTLCAISPTDPIPKKFFGDVLVIETNSDHPGFARLRYHDSGTYFKRSQLLQSLSLGPALKGTFMSLIELNSLLSREENIRFKEQLRKYEITTVDLVSCVVCPIWPTAAVEWIGRKRSSGWPTKELLSKVVIGGCHFVAKAHPSCPNDETLFRFSFSCAEIVLVNSWSAVQKYIYHILRLLKNSVYRQCKERHLESAISSYTIKTLTLRACEEKPFSFWNKSNTSSSVRELLSELIQWLIDGSCYNYFIPSHNMFEHTTGDVDSTIQILLSFLFNESIIAKLISRIPIADSEIYLPFPISDKLLLLGQLGVNRVSHFVNPLNADSCDSLKPDRLAAGGSEFYHLVTGLMANLQAAKNTVRHRSGLNSDLERTADMNLCEAMRATRQTTSSTLIHPGISFLENIPYLTGRQKLVVRRRCIYVRRTDWITEESQRAYDRHRPSYLDLKTGIAANWFIQATDKAVVKATFFMSAAYRANFCFTYLKQYGKCMRICQEAKEVYCALQKKIGFNELCNNVCSVILSRKWSAIFDECIQTVFGFILLHEYCLNRPLKEVRNSIVQSTNLDSFVIYISPMTFIEYVDNQCLRRYNGLLADPDTTYQYLECSELLLEAVCMDQVVRLTTESHKHLRSLSRAVSIDILKVSDLAENTL